MSPAHRCPPTLDELMASVAANKHDWRDLQPTGERLVALADIPRDIPELLTVRACPDCGFPL